MSTKYQSSKDVPLKVIISRLNDLAGAIIKGRESQSREFTMRIPAECDRDADLVISEAAIRIGSMSDQVEQAQARVAELEKCVDDGSDAWLLRKQAEAVEGWANDQHLPPDEDLTELGWHAKRIYGRAKDYAQRLRQQADDIDKGGE